MTGLGTYFEVVVDAVRAEGGDVLKFIGDGVLSVFPADGNGRRRSLPARRPQHHPGLRRSKPPRTCRLSPRCMYGPVVYGNIGSLDRLDFTVVGPTVNYVSRLEGVAKLLDRQAVCSQKSQPPCRPKWSTILGQHMLKGFDDSAGGVRAEGKRTSLP